MFRGRGKCFGSLAPKPQGCVAWGQGKRSGSLAPRPQGDVAWRRGQRSGHEGHGRNNILEVSYVISSAHTIEWIGNFSVVYRVVTLLLIGEHDELYYL